MKVCFDIFCIVSCLLQHSLLQHKAKLNLEYGVLIFKSGIGVVLPAKGKKITPFKPLFFSKSWQRPPSFYWEVAYLGARDFLRRFSKVKKYPYLVFGKL